MALSPSSPWHKTLIVNSSYLGLFKIRPIPESDDDPLYVIEEQYTHRPDLLAFDMYNDHKLWWVFAQRNMDVILDPVYDITAGTEIFLPQANLLKKYLGL
jgi:hypothetical protein